MKTVIKRDGRRKEFNSKFIDIAISKAEEEVKGISSDLGVRIASLVEDYLDENSIEEISIEQIQDLVVEYLNQEDKDIAKAYNDYREKRTKERKHPIDKQILELLEGENEFLAKENANKNSTLVSTQRDLMAGTISRDLSLKLLSTTNEMIKTARMSEMTIIYGNRYKPIDKDIEKGEYILTCHRKKIQDNISKSEEPMSII